MATEDTVKSLVDSVLSNPDFLSQIAAHPYSAVREAAGSEDVSRDEVSEAITALSALMGGNQVDFGSLSSMASGLLSENNGSAHDLSSALFGDFLTGIPMEESGASVDLGADILSNLANIDFAKGMAGIDLSDGIGIDDVVGFAKGIFSK